MPLGYCRFTHRPIESASDGIWDDGDWISWDYISSLGDSGQGESSSHTVSQELRDIFESLVHTAAAYKQHTGRYLNIFGELGELYAEIELGIRRNKLNAPGSDGRLGNDFIEVKTISPLKQDDKVQVKRKGNFNKLYVVKISENFFFEGRMIDRRDLKKGEGKFASVKFADMESDDE
ncbi:MAG: hypothetical protein K0U72_06490 [Gammaproteobacteria bacterium]|nr:hypothetical protein [Gammaproteobacteria bacterium]